MVAAFSVLGLAIGLVGGGGAAAQAAAAPTPGVWNLQPTPTIPGASSSGLLSTSCWTATACVAVGAQTTLAGVEVPLVEATIGGPWTLEHLAVPPGSTSYDVTSVACAAGGWCQAVGHATLAAATENIVEQRLSDGNWVVTTIAGLPGQRSLASVSCGSATGCVAIGADASEVYNGTSWRVVPFAVPAGADGVAMRAVSCPDPSGCLAIGQAGDAPVAELWNGAAWSVTGQPLDVNAKVVSCTALDACTAVGATAERWDGTAWPAQVLRVASWQSWDGVSCSTATRCLAVGYGPGTAECCGSPIAALWANGTWREVGLGGLSSNQGYGGLSGVDCPSATDCVAVGDQGLGIAEDPQAITPLAMRGSGWTLSAKRVASPGGSVAASIAAVSCWASGGCLSVGSRTNSYGVAAPLAERLDASRWSVVAPPSNATELTGVWCVSATDCVAVGDINRRGGVADTWNGSTWTMTALPTPPASLVTTVSSVTCLSASDCEAVGSSETTTGQYSQQPLIEVYDGSTWQIQPSPSPLPADATDGPATLSAVSRPALAQRSATPPITRILVLSALRSPSRGTAAPGLLTRSRSQPAPPTSSAEFPAPRQPSVSPSDRHSTPPAGRWPSNGTGPPGRR
jgi:hypothetical protein